MENFFIKKKRLSTMHPFDAPESLSQYETVFELYHDFLVLSKNTLFLVDKKTHAHTEIAKIDSPVIHFSPSPSNAFFILVTQDQTVLLNNLFDTINTESVATRECHVCWGDDQVLISRETVRIYNLSLELVFEGYAHSPMAFREEYYVYSIFDSGCLKFIEQNGLVLEVLDHIEVKGDVVDIRFVNKNMMVGIAKDSGNTHFFVLHCCNNYWYLKMMVETDEMKISKMSGDSVYVRCGNTLWEYIFEVYYAEYKGAYVVNDGKCAKLTYFDRGLVPPPLEHVKIEVYDYVNLVAIWREYICLVTPGDIIVLRYDELYHTFPYKEICSFIKPENINMSHIHQKIETLNITRTAIEFVEIVNNRLYIVFGSYVCVYNIVEKKIENIVHKANVNRVYTLDNEVGYRTDDSFLHKDIKIPVDIKQNLVVTTYNKTLFYLKDKQLHIQTDNESIDIQAVSSFKVHDDYLLFMKGQKLVTWNLKTNRYQLYTVHETNAKLLHVCDTRIILLAARGNLEIFESRFMVQQKIISLIQNRKYDAAIQLSKENCILFALFTNKVFAFNELFGSLPDKNVIINFVVQIYDEFAKQHREPDGKIPLSSINYENETFELYENIKFVFNHSINTRVKFIDHVMGNIDGFNEIKIKIYSKLNLLEESMPLVMDDLTLLNSAKISQKDEKLIQTALGTYDLEFTKKVIYSLNKEIYLDLIAEIQNHEEIDKRIAINKTLNRRDKIVFYLSQRSEDEEREFIVENKQYKIVPEMRAFYSDRGQLSFLSRFDTVIVETQRSTVFYDLIQANYLYGVNKSQSVPFYMAAGCHQQAFDIALEVQEWKEACKINELIGDEDNYMKVIQFLVKQKKYCDIACVYLNYLEDRDNAYLYYIKSYLFKEAQRINPRKFTMDLETIQTTTLEEICTLIKYIKELIIRFDGIVNRQSTFDDMSTTTTLTTSSKRNVLRNKVGSRFEKEYVLSQVRETVEKIKVYRASLAEVGAVAEIDFKTVYLEVVRIFEYAESVYDSSRPFVAMPVWNE